jgi:predicted NAD/FAD-dependent oxidoreductase
VNDWCERELLRPWTNSLDVYRGDEIQEPSVGPMRYAAASGLRSLVADAFETMQNKVDYQPNFDVVEVDQLIESSVQAIVFACPVPQAMRVLSPWLSDEQRLDLARFSSSPVISAWAWFAEKAWVDFNAAFINEHPLLSLMADDGARRGDGAPVLVAHSTEAFARSNESAEGKAEELIAAASQLLNFDEAAVGFGVHRWGLAQPRLTDQNPFWHAPNLLPRRKGGTRDDLDVMVGICGDEWGGRPKIETAWLSGQRLGRFIAEALAA